MKIKNNLTEQIFFFSTYNEALRTLPDRRGLPMLTGKRYKTIKQAEAILSANAYEIMNDDHTPYVPQDDNVKFQPEPAPTKPDADVMTQFTAAIAKMVNVKLKLDGFEPILGNFLDALFSDVFLDGRLGNRRQR